MGCWRKLLVLVDASVSADDENCDSDADENHGERRGHSVRPRNQIVALHEHAVDYVNDAVRGVNVTVENRAVLILP